ncbi:DUF6565 domain-containing protein [Pontibacter indicus]|uniref:Uncharacterized protein n=1 Tax=Pontibacter indicus TaxID=1317125 RepID=A0A1R3X2V6_9BACT|nr:DUF6565 domain-containing protein [Pontibacter indicus]SIT85253.1 hypothetical protein SAMN05444128_1511 [Pontibacter indicus]
MLNLKPKYLTGLLAVLLLWSCEGNRTAQETEEITVEVPADTARVERTGRTVGERLESLRGWMNEKVERGDTAIQREMPGIKEDFRKRSAEIEENLDSLSADSKAEYARLKERYERWENRQERRLSTPLDRAELDQWEEQLLREFKDTESIAPQDMREAYLTFMGVIRAKRRNWTQHDWDYVDNVYGQLNQRRGQVENQLSNSDKLKIRALQAEYLTLEGAADAQSTMRNMRN